MLNNLRQPLLNIARVFSTLALAFWPPMVPPPFDSQLDEQCKASAEAEAAFRKKADRLLAMAYDATSRGCGGSKVDRAGIAHLGQLMDLYADSRGEVNVKLALKLRTDSLGEIKGAGYALGSVIGNIATVQVTTTQLPGLATLSSVEAMSASNHFAVTNDRAAQGIGATTNAGSRLVSQTGRGVAIGIIDTGVDFRHLDFTRPGSNGHQTRIKAMLDMTMYNPTTIVVNGNNITIDRDWNYTLAGGNYPSGRLVTEAEINAALQLPKPANQDFDLVKQRDKHGHGTHVAGIAAGNGLGAPAAPGRYAGMAPESDLIVVKANLSNSGVYEFGAAYQIDALNFVKEQAQALGEPFVINMSYGDHFGPHDGSHILDQAIDNLVSSAPGRVVCVAAGNSGNENIHASGDVSSGSDITLNIAQPVGDNPGFMELYYPGSDRFSITITKPNGAVLGPFSYSADLYVNLAPGDPHVSVYNTTDPHYGSNNIYVGFKDASRNIGFNPWSIRLHGAAAPGGGHFNAWIWRGNFTTFVDSAARLTTPGEARGAITVGAWTTRASESVINNYAVFSSTGPTVDGRQKPDISAPGNFLYSSKSSDFPQLNYIYGSGSDALAAGVDPARYGGLAGTSMSTPVTTGAIALLLQANPNLRADELKEILKNTATHDAFTGAGWSPRFGWGKLNIAAAISAALPNPIDNARFFVRQHYLDFLSREPDQGGWDYWTSQLAQCGADQTCQDAQRVGISAAYFIEAEFQQTGSYVYRFYKATYGQRPTYAQFGPDRSTVVGGANLEAGKEAFAQNWVQRQPFLQKYPAGLDGQQFIGSLLGTVLQGSAIELSGKTGELLAEYQLGVSENDSRARTLRKLIEYQEFRDAEYNRAFVLMQYFGYLRRNPDENGYQFWLDILNNRSPGNFRGMVCAFINSAEYQLRFSPVVTRNDHVCSGI